MSDKSRHFHDLHIKGNPVVLFNIWDAGSAGAVQAAGAQALATGSMPVAMAQGFEDGENIPLQMALDNVVRIRKATNLPLSMDLEGGYGCTPEAVAKTVAAAVDVGISGFNFEDQIVGGQGIYPIAEQSERIRAARVLAGDTFLNARTDIFLKAPAETHNTQLLTAAIERAKAFEQAGADGFFAPALVDITLIEKLCAAVTLPVNILALPHAPDKQTLANVGVARISYGPVPYRQMLAWLKEQASCALK